MLAKASRLAKDQEIKQVFARGRGFFNPLLNLKHLSSVSPTVRFAFVVSTKVSKKAVARNRLKRILREFVRQEQKNFLPGDYVLVLKPKAAKVAEATLLFEFKELLLKARVYKQ